MRISDWSSDVCSSDLDAGGGGEQRADQDDRHAETAAQAAEQPAHGLQQLLGDAAVLQHHAHEDEQRNGDQDVVGDDAEDALAERAEQRGRSEEHTSELQSLMRISYAVFCLKKTKQTQLA